MELHLKSAENKLMQMLRGMGHELSDWQAVHFHLSGLLEEYKSEYQVKIAVNLAHDLLKNYQGGIFLLHDQSLMVLCQRLEKPIRDKLIFQLRYLYMDDPLAYSDTGQENAQFCTPYELRDQGQEFFELCSRCLAVAGRKSAIEGKFSDVKPEPKPAEAGKPYPRLSLELPEKEARNVEKPPVEWTEIAAPPKKTDRKIFSASSLALIERDLDYADLHRAIRRQPVCAVTEGMKVRRVFDELYIHIAHLRQMLHSEVDFLSNRWLFKYLTRILDERMLDHMRRHGSRYLDAPVSINLNVETLLSSWFAAFDAAIKPQAKVSIVIEIPVIDVFADMAGFLLARAEVQKLGYRVCLDGLTTASFTNINREKLGLDLVKVQWNADMQSDLLTTQENRDLAAAVQATGSNRIILCRCDTKSAVEYGQALGISLFQGRYIDGLINPAAKVVN